MMPIPVKPLVIECGSFAQGLLLVTYPTVILRCAGGPCEQVVGIDSEYAALAQEARVRLHRSERG